MTNLSMQFSDIFDVAQLQRTRTLVDTLHLAGVVTTYKPAAKIAGYGDNHQRDKNFHRHLGQTMKEDCDAGTPLRCSLIINAKWGMPGQQYFEMARSLRFPIASTPAAERAFWEDQIRHLGLDPSNLLIR